MSRDIAAAGLEKRVCFAYPRWHTVVAGDVLSAIAQRYALELEHLKRLNQLDGAASGLRPGQRLTVCEARVPGTTFMPKLW
jgi:LysM repeat protein